ncbi:MAG: DUF4177 domain-containing protein [Mariprofundaceae bacterium]|nr:DUF4177 domain-containing protein [Mariprofundaceae bacterium]
MPVYEYKVVPAPKKGRRLRGVRSAEMRFAHAVQEVMNEHGASGWEFLRSDTLPSEERQGLTGRAKVFQTLLVFRRAIEAEVAEAAPETGAVAAEPDAAEARREPVLRAPRPEAEADGREVEPEALGETLQVAPAESGEKRAAD